ncbi:MAG: hypothetical protein WCI48_01815 [Bacteroidota bacterium]|jgi:hypothetical protein
MNRCIFITCFFISILLNSFPVHSQAWLWANHVGSESSDIACGTSDKNGNFYIAGSFTGSYYQFVNQTISKLGNNGLFLAKYDSSGNEIWVHQLDDYLTYEGGIADIIIDNNDNIYITGLFYRTINFGNVKLFSGTHDLYVAKFNSAGNCI